MTTVRARRLIPAALTVIAALSLAACGDDESTTAATDTPPATDITITTDAAANTTVPTAPRTTPPTSTATSTATSTPAIPGLISVTVGVDSSPDRVEQVALDSEVTLVIVNPQADDEFHLHGFDLGDGAVVPAGQPASFTFTATKAGSFELESHITEDVYLVLEVS